MLAFYFITSSGLHGLKVEYATHFACYNRQLVLHCQVFQQRLVIEQTKPLIRMLEIYCIQSCVNVLNFQCYH
jgi:hypothetical protein